MAAPLIVNVNHKLLPTADLAVVKEVTAALVKIWSRMAVEMDSQDYWSTHTYADWDEFMSFMAKEGAGEYLQKLHAQVVPRATVMTFNKIPTQQVLDFSEKLGFKVVIDLTRCGFGTLTY
eukprot:NODE_2636_length_530_cov_33.330025_g2586_i0.p1 GENE.NODE_2636_length_530_cov_33.330025_g2586_i0~~NODE_2636_length_530_cov_33.330025_g2586_i0.p1  ORF type:complete len:120 (-),score=24.59 NODE_2636_length_530_cov_33.330025_g2586_i0:96-455(-)